MNYEKIKCLFAKTWIMKHLCLQCKRIMKMSIWNTRIMKIGKFLFVIMNYEQNYNVCFAKHELCTSCLYYMNYEKFLFKTTWIMKKLNCLFAMHELWKYFFAIMTYEIKKMLFAILTIWKHENICLQYMKYENMNILLILHELWKYLLALH